jgi:hypothetical protein
VSSRRGPALVYTDSAGTRHDITRHALTDPRERALCGALLDLAAQLAEQADKAQPPRPFGFTLTADTSRSGD